jgi:uncharacterized cupredoxin-like copper-binding protein
MSRTLRGTAAVLSIAAAALAGCAAGQPSASPTAASASPTSASASPTAASVSPTTAAAATTVQVNLQEWAVVPASTSASAGQVTFKVTNTGPDDIHEFVVLKTDLDPAALPTDSTGAVSETGAGITVADEIEDIPLGQTQDLTVPLDAGKYVLLCNIYDETEKEAHYKMGMRIAFDVTP